MKDSEVFLQSLLEVSSSEARCFFLKSHSYCNLNLPSYFDFSNLINEFYFYLSQNEIDFKENKPSSFGNVNYEIRTNKDGDFDWRLFELINPALYVDLAHYLTRPENWAKIISRLNELKNSSTVQCESMPLYEHENASSAKSNSIRRWWDRIEQQSIFLSIKYNYLFITDIANCYPSIYTHSIEWAIETKELSKQRNRNSLGSKIDCKVRNLTYGQTNGIPQGSVLMDFIAEIILFYADSELTKKIKEFGISSEDYKILRYRDDYRVFSKNKDTVDLIARALNLTLQELGMKTNPLKTFFTDDVVLGAIKNDKKNALVFFDRRFHECGTQDKLIKIILFSKENKNSNQITHRISKLNSSISSLEDFNEDVYVLIPMVVVIMRENPCCVPEAAQLISNLLNFLSNHREKVEFIKLIKQSLKTKLNTGFLDIWFQRIYLPFSKEMNNEDDEEICKLVLNGFDSSYLWNLDWVKSEEINKIFRENSVVDFEELDRISPVIQDDELVLVDNQFY